MKMNTRILLLFVFFGGLLTVTTSQETKSVADHQSDPVRFIDTKDEIFIDETQTVEGSAAVGDLDDEASGIGPDDEDTFEGSGDTGSGEVKPRINLPVELPPLPITPAPTRKAEPTTEAPPKVTKSTTTKTYHTEATTTITTPPEISTHRSNKVDHPVSPERTPGADMDNTVNVMGRVPEERQSTSFFSQPGILAAIIGGAVVGLLCAILLVMFIVYRMRKKDEGSYQLDEPRRSPRNTSYHPANKDSKEFFA